MESNEVWLNEEQRSAMKKFSTSGKHSAMMIRRAKVIMALDRTGRKDHIRVGRICEGQGISRQALNEIRKDFFEAGSVEEFLTRKKRETPPFAAKITGEVEAHIVALACSQPPNGHARWTVRLLCEKSVELKYVDGIAPSTMHHLLKKRNISLT